MKISYCTWKVAFGGVDFLFCAWVVEFGLRWANALGCLRKAHYHPQWIALREGYSKFPHGTAVPSMFNRIRNTQFFFSISYCALKVNVCWRAIYSIPSQVREAKFQMNTHLNHNEMNKYLMWLRLYCLNHAWHPITNTNVCDAVSVSLSLPVSLRRQSSPFSTWSMFWSSLKMTWSG